jgi:hypothetical protein
MRLNRLEDKNKTNPTYIPITNGCKTMSRATNVNNVHPTNSTEHVLIRHGKHHFEVINRWEGVNMAQTFICWTLDSALKVAAKEYPDLPVRVEDVEEQAA